MRTVIGPLLLLFFSLVRLGLGSDQTSVSISTVFGKLPGFTSGEAASAIAPFIDHDWTQKDMAEMRILLREKRRISKFYMDQGDGEDRPDIEIRDVAALLLYDFAYDGEVFYSSVDGSGKVKAIFSGPYKQENYRYQIRDYKPADFDSIIKKVDLYLLGYQKGREFGGKYGFPKEYPLQAASSVPFWTDKRMSHLESMSKRQFSELLSDAAKSTSTLSLLDESMQHVFCNSSVSSPDGSLPKDLKVPEVIMAVMEVATQQSFATHEISDLLLIAKNVKASIPYSSDAEKDSDRICAVYDLDGLGAGIDVRAWMKGFERALIDEPVQDR